MGLDTSYNNIMKSSPYKLHKLYLWYNGNMDIFHFYIEIRKREEKIISI